MMEFLFVLFVFFLASPVVALWDVKLTYKNFFKSDK